MSERKKGNNENNDSRAPTYTYIHTYIYTHTHIRSHMNMHAYILTNLLSLSISLSHSRLPFEKLLQIHLSVRIIIVLIIIELAHFLINPVAQTICSNYDLFFLPQYRTDDFQPMVEVNEDDRLFSNSSATSKKVVVKKKRWEGRRESV